MQDLRRAARQLGLAILLTASAMQLAWAKDSSPTGPSPGQQDASAPATKTSQTGGVFQILGIGRREATFRFVRTNGHGSTWRDTYTVDAGPGGDVHLAIVRKITEVIRKDYTGSFDYQSVRLGRTVILSARIEDNAELEDFLMKEFFGEGGIVK